MVLLSPRDVLLSPALLRRRVGEAGAGAQAVGDAPGSKLFQRRLDLGFDLAVAGGDGLGRVVAAFKEELRILPRRRRQHRRRGLGGVGLARAQEADRAGRAEEMGEV